MTDAAIIDIDGTLADVRHRQHHVSGSNPDWKAFFDAMPNDPPREAVVALVDMLALGIQFRPPMQLFICSGRPETHRKQTEKWLAKHCSGLWVMTGSEFLLMRPEGNYEADYKIKAEMLAGIQGQGYEVQFVIDDRQSVVDMWRSHGIVCFQCDDGNWENRQPVTPGKLILLVGPAGAGKTSYAADNFEPSMVVSSDAIRAELNSGDFKCQERNTDVFRALHAIVKTRIENGLDTVVDATNIKNRSRRALRDLVPRTCGIEYHVIDRPLASKLKTADWRVGVRVKGKPLIEYHDEVFHANLKDIVAGDGDQRVTVYWPGHCEEDVLQEVTQEMIDALA